MRCHLCKDELMKQRAKDDQILSMNDCKHCFHSLCLQSYLYQKYNEQKIPFITCPFQGCTKLIQKKQTESEINQHLRKINTIYSVVCCPTEDCPFMFKRDLHAAPN